MNKILSNVVLVVYAFLILISTIFITVTALGITYLNLIESFTKEVSIIAVFVIFGVAIILAKLVQLAKKQSEGDDDLEQQSEVEK